MVIDLGHLGTQHADGAIVGGKDVGQKSHVAADGGPALYQVDMQARIGQVQSGGDAGHASSYHQHILAHGYALRLQGL